MPSQIQVSGFTNIQGKLCESRVALWTLIKHHAIQLIENQRCTAAALSWEVHLFWCYKYIKMRCWLWSTNFRCLIHKDMVICQCPNIDFGGTTVAICSPRASFWDVFLMLPDKTRGLPGIPHVPAKVNVEAVVGDPYIWYCSSNNKCIIYIYTIHIYIYNEIVF